MKMAITRRQFLKGAGALGIGMALPLKFGIRDAHAFYQSPGLQKYIQPLRGVGPGQIPVVGSDGIAATGATHATIRIGQFQDQLHPSLGKTTLWGYNPVTPLGGIPANPNPMHLGGIIVVQKGAPLQLTFQNTLPNKAIIPIDTTLPGANQGVNRTAIHLHGGLVPWISDGGPFDWWAPNGTHGLSFLNNQVLDPGAAANEAEYYYPNNQSARMLWYHDHAFGTTRTNAYAGLATAYIIRDTFEAGLMAAGLPDFIENSVLAGQVVRDLPIVVQDKIFVGTNIKALDPTWVSKGLPSTLGSLWYPHIYEKNRWRLIGAGRNLPNPSVIAEMFGDTMLVNGTVYPEAAVEPRVYRLRILNACNARFLNLQLYVDNGTPNSITYDVNGNPTNAKGPDWLVIGTEGGFLPNPAVVPSNSPFNPLALDWGGGLLTGNAERWDVLVDFSAFKGQKIVLYSDAPAPFPGGDPRNDYIGANGFGPDTRQLMRFNVGTSVTAPFDAPLTITTATSLAAGIDPFLATIGPNGTYALKSGVVVKTTRQLTLNEGFDAYGRLTQFLGTNTLGPSGNLYGRTLHDPVTENPKAGDVEIWEIANLTGDTHPIHFHLVNVQILNREPFNAAVYNGTPTFLPGGPYSPSPMESGWKETVRMNPGEVIRVIMKFDLPAGLPFAVPASPRTGGHEYVWHCHILEHEEHDMMRPLVVT
jgi:spore coat protein A, manganese oxidase